MQERIFKTVPKQRRSSETYEQPYPIPEVELNISDGVIDQMLEAIDEVTE